MRKHIRAKNRDIRSRLCSSLQKRYDEMVDELVNDEDENLDAIN